MNRKGYQQWVEKLEELQKEDNELDKQKDHEESEKGEDLEAKYSALHTQLWCKMEKVKLHLADYHEQIHKYSSFDVMVMGYAISDLMSIIEDTPFKYTQIPIEEGNLNPKLGIFEGCLVVIKDSVLQNLNGPIDYETLKQLSEDRSLLLLRDNNMFTNIRFYNYLDESPEYLESFDFGSFIYVKDFIESLVFDRLEHKIERISEEEIRGFLKLTVNDYLDKREERINSEFLAANNDLNSALQEKRMRIKQISERAKLITSLQE